MVLGNGAVAPAGVGLNIGGYFNGQPPINGTGGEPPKGESVIYSIPPAVWILVFLLVGYFGMRYVMED